MLSFPGDYKAYECTGINCPVCELENPNCVGLPNGKNAFLGREQTPWYIECRGERTINKLTCPGGNNFDPVERRCLGEQGVGKVSVDILYWMRFVVNGVIFTAR